MKIIISHDVDLLTAAEHSGDLLIVKRIVRSFIECALGFASAREVVARFTHICRNKVHRLPELIAFDKENQVPSTFFFGMANGMYLNYSVEMAEPWIRKVLQAGLSAGVHGVSYDDLESMRVEHETFKKITGLHAFGIRMHYLRMSSRTLDYLDKLGYAFDTSLHTLALPYKKGRMWEFPLHIMDGTIFYGKNRWIEKTFEQARQQTIEMLEKADSAQIPFFTILLHDPYFGPSFRHMDLWYRWLIRYAGENGLEFTDYMSAIRELES